MLNPCEICQGLSGVALRKESVDRNLCKEVLLVALKGSLSARRAWIEIGMLKVAVVAMARRSPQGERG